MRANRKRFFSARIVACLLAFLLAAIPFAFAYAETTDNDAADQSQTTEAKKKPEGKKSKDGAALKEEKPLNLGKNNQVDPQQQPDSSFIYDTSIEELCSGGAHFNGQEVQIMGEAILDDIVADWDRSHRWVSLKSLNDASTVSVYMSKESAKKIDLYGKYGTRGSIVKVRGDFNAVCSSHDGECDIHAEEVVIARAGEKTPDAFKPGDYCMGIVLVMLGGIAFGVGRYVEQRNR